MDGRDKKPLVSVVMPCWNAERWMRESIECALAQTYANKEVILVDDGSTDRSLEIAKSFGDRVRVEEEAHGGLSAARNRLTRLSRGEFIQYFDCDDLMDREKIERQVEVALAHPGCVVYGPWRYVRYGPDGTVLETEEQQTEAVGEDEDILAMALRGWYCPAHSYLWPREALETVGAWDESLIVGTDPDYAMRALVAGVRFVYAPGAWVDYHLHEAPRLSTRRLARYLRSRVRSIRKIQRMLEGQGRLRAEYRRAIARRYDEFSRIHWEDCRATSAWTTLAARRISGRPTEEGAWYYRLWRRAFGLYCAENAAVLKRRIRGLFTTKTRRHGKGEQ
ncbi:MAG: glycosyltransferase [Planctomycetota bacterium]